MLVTGHGNESLVAAALRRGADDYLAKDSALSDLLPQILERVRRTRELRKALAAAEQDLVRAERLAAIGEMTVTLHHEINNPLMAAFAEVELLLSDAECDAGSAAAGSGGDRQALRRIRDIVQRIGKLREVRSKDYLRGVQMLDLERKRREAVGAAAGTALDPRARRGSGPDRVPAAAGGGISGRALRHHRRAAGVGGTDRGNVVVIAGGASTPGAHPLGGFVPRRIASTCWWRWWPESGTAATAAGSRSRGAAARSTRERLRRRSCGRLSPA